MADPGTILAVVSIAASVGSAVLGVVGAQQTAAATAQRNAYNAAVARNNVIRLEQLKERATIVAAQKEALVLEEARREQRNINLAAQVLAADQRNRYAAVNVEVDTGTPQEVVEATLLLGAQDAFTAYALGKREAATVQDQLRLDLYALNAQQEDERATIGLLGIQTANAQTAANLNSAGALLTGIGSAASTALTAREAGIPGFAPTDDISVPTSNQSSGSFLVG